MTKWGTLLRVNDQNSVTIQHANETILWAIDENMDTNLQAVTSIFTLVVWKHKNSNFVYKKIKILKN